MDAIVLFAILATIGGVGYWQRAKIKSWWAARKD